MSDVSITLPDGSRRTVPAGTAVRDVADSDQTTDVHRLEDRRAKNQRRLVGSLLPERPTLLGKLTQHQVE